MPETNGNGSKEPVLRQWMTRITCGLTLVTLAIIGYWASSFDAIQRSNVERIVRLEEARVSTKEVLVEIKASQADMQRTLNRIALNSGLREEK